MDNSDGFTGWVTRNGECVECGSYGHIGAARGLGEMYPDDAGWVHYSNGIPEPVAMRVGERYLPQVTQRQFNVMCEIQVECGNGREWWFDDLEIVVE